jgi:long-chain acyl-CoA synthetase
MALRSAFQLSADRNPGKMAVAFDTDGLTFSEFHRLSRNIAHNLIAAGAEPGDRVALHLLNGLELALAAAGCLSAGFIVVPVNTRLKGREIDYILRHSGSAFYIGEPQFYDEIVHSCPALEVLSQPWLTGPATDTAHPFEDLLQTPSRDGPLPDIPAEETAAILYTSGTTAHAKGVVHTHGTLLEAARAAHDMELHEDQVVIVMSSMAHLVGFGMCFLSALVNGATTVITKPFDFEGALSAFERWHGTYTVSLPALLQCFLKTQTQAPRDLSSARFFFGGGDSVTPALQEAFAGSIAPICEAYGATEITPTCWNRPGEVRVGSIGRPGNGVEFRLRDVHGEDVSTGSVGEILIRGPHLMKGYWQDPEATRAAFQDGWFRSGDLATRDADGFYWFAGRKKEIIIRGGSNISPQEVEAAISEHSAVAEAGVVGRKDSLWGEIVVAHVALRPGQRLDEQDLIAFARERLADYKVPATVIFHSELPKGVSGKIQRRALRDLEALTAVT